MTNRQTFNGTVYRSTGQNEVLRNREEIEKALRSLECSDWLQLVVAIPQNLSGKEEFSDFLNSEMIGSTSLFDIVGNIKVTERAESFQGNRRNVRIAVLRGAEGELSNATSAKLSSVDFILEHLCESTQISVDNRPLPGLLVAQKAFQSPFVYLRKDPKDGSIIAMTYNPAKPHHITSNARHYFLSKGPVCLPEVSGAEDGKAIINSFAYFDWDEAFLGCIGLERSTIFTIEEKSGTTVDPLNPSYTVRDASDYVAKRFPAKLSPNFGTVALGIFPIVEDAIPLAWIQYRTYKETTLVIGLETQEGQGRKGYATKLIDCILQKTRSVFVEAGEDNAAAMALYNKIGTPYRQRASIKL